MHYYAAIYAQVSLVVSNASDLRQNFLRKELRHLPRKMPPRGTTYLEVR
jgi:hypothetical protein